MKSSNQGQDEQFRSLLSSQEGSQGNSTNYSSLVATTNDGDTCRQSEGQVRLQNGDADEESAYQPEATGEDDMPFLTIVSILSTAFSYGCILTTLFMITLPIECERINKDHPNIPKSVALGSFVAIAGITQLVSPLIGRLSDTYMPPYPDDLGQRMPYLVFGSICTVIGLLGEVAASFYGFWIRYGFAFFLSIIGLNIMYTVMIALIPDQVPAQQTGVANGILALLLVTGSLFGFGLFHSFLNYRIQNMYGLYTCIVIFTSILTGTHAHDKDVELTSRLRRRLSSKEETPFVPSPVRSGPKWKKAAKKAARKAKQIVLAPTVIVRTMLVDPFHNMDWYALGLSYTIDRRKYHDFFVVTVSRLFYYCGMSIQTFFLYYLQDVIGVSKNAENVVANLAILGQCTGAITCYPVGVLSDRYLGGRRKPFVYFACAVLAATTLALIWARTMKQMVILCLILGGANGIYLTMDTSLAVDTLPKEFDGDGGHAQLLGVWGVAAFLGAALGPMISGPLLYIVGYKGTATTEIADNGEEVPGREEYSLAGYAVVLLFSSFYFFCSAFSLRYIK